MRVVYWWSVSGEGGTGGVAALLVQQAGLPRPRPVPRPRTLPGLRNRGRQRHVVTELWWGTDVYEGGVLVVRVGGGRGGGRPGRAAGRARARQRRQRPRELQQVVRGLRLLLGP